ncbi:uncharacterized protein LOC106873266 [Octopus bimaculoides]|uniref:Uncharacterized protein n=1 Tax=Octopus bimaculoides TaxID=37653 RepID=A0A0L8ID65_OCTBM|nr:uncharacterized protein LOC106873266 [Octopus bimaculoides]|eukprot:XP_014776048.1 PREDICTED: uncharacterized protein LOC106873266 [Octopus bimaculoides]
MAIENVQPSSEETYRKSCFKTESSSDKRKNMLLKALTATEIKVHSSLVTEDSQAESSNSDKALPKNAEDQQKGTPFFVTQPKEDDGEFIDTKQSADGRKCMEEKEYIDIKDEMMREDLLNKEARCDENSSAYSPVKEKYKGYEVLFDDNDVNRRIISSNDKLMNINALRQALKTEVPFKRRIPKNFTQELVLKSKEVASKSGNSLDERINKILQNIREQSVLHEVSLGDIFNNQALYKEEYKEARKLIKQIENYYANSFFNKRQQQKLRDKNRPQS